MKQFLADKRIPMLQHPSLITAFSPPCDFYLFPKLKSALRGTHFQTVDEVKSKTADLPNGVSADYRQHCFEQWKIRIQRRMDGVGEYVDGDSN
jgi:hypothetical protein